MRTGCRRSPHSRALRTEHNVHTSCVDSQQRQAASEQKQGGALFCLQCQTFCSCATCARHSNMPQQRPMLQTHSAEHSCSGKRAACAPRPQAVSTSAHCRRCKMQTVHPDIACTASAACTCNRFRNTCATCPGSKTRTATVHATVEAQHVVQMLGRSFAPSRFPAARRALARARHVLACDCLPLPTQRLWHATCTSTGLLSSSAMLFCALMQISRFHCLRCSLRQLQSCDTLSGARSANVVEQSALTART